MGHRESPVQNTVDVGVEPYGESPSVLLSLCVFSHRLSLTRYPSPVPSQTSRSVVPEALTSQVSDVCLRCDEAGVGGPYRS